MKLAIAITLLLASTAFAQSLPGVQAKPFRDHQLATLVSELPPATIEFFDANGQLLERREFFYRDDGRRAPCPGFCPHCRPRDRASYVATRRAARHENNVLFPWLPGDVFRGRAASWRNVNERAVRQHDAAGRRDTSSDEQRLERGAAKGSPPTDPTDQPDDTNSTAAPTADEGRDRLREARHDRRQPARPGSSVQGTTRRQGGTWPAWSSRTAGVQGFGGGTRPIGVRRL